MRVKELIEQLKTFNEDAEVTVCNLDHDDEEQFHFDTINGSEQIESSKQLWVAIYFYGK